MQNVRVTRSITGKYRISFDCPGCEERLRCPLSDAGKDDNCPECGATFTVPGAQQREEIRQAELRAVEEKCRVIEDNVAAKVQQRAENERKRVEKLATQARQQMESERNRQEKLERDRVDRERPKCEVCGASVQPGESRCDSCLVATESTNVRRRGFITRRRILIVLALTVAFMVYQSVRHSDLREKLKSCESSGNVNADVYYTGFFAEDMVVLDLQSGGSPAARRIDPVHLLMQFADKLNLYSIKRIVLARNGKEVFYISGSDLREPANSYAGGGRIWAFNNLPERVRTMSGTQPYDEWTGGFLGVLKEQSEDVNEFIEKWTGY